MKIVQISDSHISVDHPARTVDLDVCIQQINALTEPADLVIHTGDITHNGLTEEYYIAKQKLDSLRAPYYVLTGNRDNRAELINAFADGKSIHCDDRFVQYSIDQFDTRILVLDTLCEHSNKGQLCAERLDLFEKMLNTDSNTPTLLFMHHTPFEVPPIPDPFQFEHWSEVEQLQQLLADFPNVTEVFCGHVHRNVKGNIAGLPASAITCMARDLRKGEMTDEERNKAVFKEISVQTK
jgi:3',5'-cyclic AMP phosphodiesterase CpdA